ncbi:MAG: tyrosine--tRNA ligase [Patescibacteria group bacterium]
MFWNKSQIDTDPDKIEDILTRGVEDAIVLESIRTKLSSGKKLRIKLGIDPTSPDLHLGHSVVLRKLRAFQDLGHTAVLIIGDFTAVVGDPTGKSATRPALSTETVEKNMKEYISQAGLIIDTKKAEIHHNSDWLAKLPFSEVYRLAAFINVTQILERSDFKNRLQSGSSIKIHEFFYPLMQAYDSVEIKADVELGGNDQLFNNLVGRTLMEKLDLTPQDVLTVSLLEGTDGIAKMSKSLDNYIGLRDKPNDMFGKIMSVPDSLIIKYFNLCTNKETSEIEEISAKNPRDQKIALAKEIVSMYHGKSVAEKAEKNFIDTFSKKEVPTDIQEIIGGGKMLSEIFVEAEVIQSKTEFATLIKQGAITNLDTGEKPSDIRISASPATYRIGKHRFLKIK